MGLESSAGGCYVVRWAQIGSNGRRKRANETETCLEGGIVTLSVPSFPKRFPSSFQDHGPCCSPGRPRSLPTGTNLRLFYSFACFFKLCGDISIGLLPKSLCSF